jgi:hypothetical protein
MSSVLSGVLPPEDVASRCGSGEVTWREEEEEEKEEEERGREEGGRRRGRRRGGEKTRLH